MKTGRALPRRSARSRPTCSTRTPDWPERMATWEEPVDGDQPEWDGRRGRASTTSRPAARSTCRRRTARSWPQGYAPTKHTAEFTATTDLQDDHRASGSSCSTTRTCRCDGPGRSFKGTVRADRVRGRGRAGRRARRRRRRSSSSRRRPTSTTPETPLEPIFDDRVGQAAGHRAGRVRHRRQGRDRLGHRRRPRPAQRRRARPSSSPRSRSRFPTGHVLTFHLEAEPRRLEQRRQPEQQPRPVPALGDRRPATPVADPLPERRPRDPGRSRREQRTAGQVAAVFGYWRTTVPEWKEANDRIEALWKQQPEGSSQLVLQARERRRGRRTCSSAATSSSRARPVDARRAAFLHPLPPDAEPRPRLTFAQLAGRPRSRRRRPGRSSTGSGRRTSAPAWSRTQRGPRHRRASRRRIPSCSTGWPSSSWSSGWSLKAPAPADRRLGHLPAVVEGDARAAARATRTTACWPAARGSGSRPRSSATSPLAASGLLNPKVGGPSVFPPAPAFLFQPPASYGPFTWIEATGPDRYRRALYTFRCRSTPYPCSQTFDAPNGDVVVRPPDPVEHAAPGADDAQRADLPRVRPGPGAAAPWPRAATTDAERLAYAFRRCLGRTPDGRRSGRAARACSQRQARAVRRRRGRTPGSWPPATRSSPPTLPDGRHARPAGRLDGRRPRAAEPRRDDHQGMNQAARAHRTARTISDRRHASDAGHPPLVLPASAASAWARWRSASCWARRGYAAAAATSGSQPARAQGAALRRQGQAGHLPVHGRRRRATSSCSTTSPQLAQVRRHAAAAPSCSRATAPRSSTRTRSCSARSSSSPSTASPAPSCRSCCRTWPRSSTTSPSSSRWSPTPSTTPRARSS